MNQIDTLSVNAIRILSADAIQKANSGHPGLPLGCAAAAYELWAHHMNHNPANPKWRTETVSSYPAVMVPCCCTLCCTCLATEIFPKKI